MSTPPQGVSGALAVLMRDAIKPNLMQTLEVGSPATTQNQHEPTSMEKSIDMEMCLGHGHMCNCKHSAAGVSNDGHEPLVSPEGGVGWLPVASWLTWPRVRGSVALVTESSPSTGDSGLRPRRPLCQHRPRQLLHPGWQDSAEVSRAWGIRRWVKFTKCIVFFCLIRSFK